ncbi:hypothetical protein [Bradyrhizobium guangxiense]|uniref:hypothetical protein n=1 Tax=Bradyrhizobium guangxiense TaxID=1325115 RepID=UPI0013E8C790|nr:hypothetical protein [Bradyrhizobium guangxiense]
MLASLTTIRDEPKTIGEAQLYIDEASRIVLAERAGDQTISSAEIGKPMNSSPKTGVRH